MDELTTVHITVDETTIHTQIEGNLKDVTFGLLAALHNVAVEAWKTAEDELHYHKMIHELQQALEPTAAIWDISKELRQMAAQAPEEENEEQ